MKVALTILGEPASKANSRELVTLPRFSPKHNKKIPMAASIKSEKARDYEKAAQVQIPDSARVMMQGDVRVKMTIYYASRRSDLDESVVLDVMQAKFVKGTHLVERAGVYVNDRQVKDKHIVWALDPNNPRADIEVEEMAPAAVLFESLPVPVVPRAKRVTRSRVHVDQAGYARVVPEPCPADVDPF